jgi:hypothetical protein
MNNLLEVLFRRLPSLELSDPRINIRNLFVGLTCRKRGKGSHVHNGQHTNKAAKIDAQL